MKKIILLISTVFLLYVSGTALEPVRIGLNYPTGATFKVELNDYTDPNNPIKKFPLPLKPNFEKTLTPNTSGVVSFVVGEGDPDWGGIQPNAINPNVIVDIKVSGNLVAQFNLLDMITTQASTGNGNILNDGFSSAEGVTFPDTTNLTNDFVFGSVKLNRLSNVEETKFFFDHSKAAFRTGKVNTPSWNEANLGDFSFAAGKDNKASGKGAVAFGEGTTAPSYGEVAIGSYNTTYSVANTAAPDNADRAFVIGNGTSGSLSDAFIIKKSGDMTVGGSLTVLGATVTNSALQVGTTSIDPTTSNLIVGGTSTLKDDVSIDAGKSLTVGGDLIVTGTSTLNDDVTIATGKTLTLTNLSGSGTSNISVNNDGDIILAPSQIESDGTTVLGVGTNADKVRLNLGNANTWIAKQTVTGELQATTLSTDTYTLPTAVATVTGQVLTASDILGATAWTAIPEPTVTTDGATLTGNGSVATPLAIDLSNANTWTAKQTVTGELQATTLSTDTYTLPTAVATVTGQVLTASDILGATAWTAIPEPTVTTDGATLTGNGSGATPLAIDLSNANTWTGTQTFDDASVKVITGGNLTLDVLKTADNQSLYIDNTGLVTASNGSAARQASGMFTGIHTTTATTTQTIANTNVTGTSVIIVTYQGTVVASHRITGINAGVDFTVEFSVAPLAGESVHYMIINN